MWWRDSWGLQQIVDSQQIAEGHGWVLEVLHGQQCPGVGWGYVRPGNIRRLRESVNAEVTNNSENAVLGTELASTAIGSRSPTITFLKTVDLLLIWSGREGGESIIFSPNEQDGLCCWVTPNFLGGGDLSLVLKVFHAGSGGLFFAGGVGHYWIICDSYPHTIVWFIVLGGSSTLFFTNVQNQW